MAGKMLLGLYLFLMIAKAGEGQIGECDYYFSIVPRTEYTPLCNPINGTSHVNCMALMLENQTNATRPTIQFYWSPDVSNVTGTRINVTASPSKYSVLDDFLPPSSLSWLPAEFSGTFGYERRLVISNTDLSDLGYYWCILEHPLGSPNIGQTYFSPSQRVHIYQPPGVSTPCPSSPDNSTYQEQLSEPKCCEVVPSSNSTATPTITLTSSVPAAISFLLPAAVLGMQVGGPAANSTWYLVCCTTEQVIIIIIGLSIGLSFCVVIVVMLCFINHVMIKKEQREEREAKLRADWGALGVTNECDQHRASLSECKKCSQRDNYI